MRHLLFFLALGSIFVSCNPEKKYASEIEDIQKHQKSLDSVVRVYKEIKFDSLIYIQKTALQSEKLIKRYYVADTISMKLAERLRFIKSVRKSLANIQVKEKSLENEIGALKRQFETLEIDAKSGIYGRDKLTKFLAEEKKAYGNLIENMTIVITNQDKQLRDFYFAYPMVENYINKIKPEENQQ